MSDGDRRTRASLGGAPQGRGATAAAGFAAAPGFAITATTAPLGFAYGEGIFGPDVERRSLNAIRRSLRDPECDGPDPVYAIAMDVGEKHHREALVARHLLFGVVTYAAGRLGDEPVRSQGHIHARSPRNGWSTPEVYEIWSGRAIILMQERATDDPGRCYAVSAGPGEVVVVPPSWAHATISADPTQPLTFGAWCDRAYAFEYDDVRAHGGLAWFPVLRGEAISWEPNTAYRSSTLIEKAPASYDRLEIARGVPIYTQFARDPDRFLFVPDPERAARVWRDFVP